MVRVRGLRVDPGFFWRKDGTAIFPDAKTAAQKVLADCADWHVNTLFLFAYSPVFGAMYKAKAPETKVQQDFGKQDLLGELIKAAAAPKVKVVASFRMNCEDNLWAKHPDWQAKLHNGQPYAFVKHLSAWHPAYRTWFAALIKDVAQSYPGLGGIEACEGTVADQGETNESAPDWNPEAVKAFVAKFHRQPQTGDPDWLRHRAQGLTDLHRILRDNAGGKATYMIHDLPSTGGPFSPLFDFATYAQFCGTHFSDIANLGYDFVNQGVLWQQRRRESGNNGFDPAWTGRAVDEFQHRPLPGHAQKLAHVEVTSFYPWETPPQVPVTPDQFQTALSAAFQRSAGTTVYSYHQLKDEKTQKSNGFATALKSVYSTLDPESPA